MKQILSALLLVALVATISPIPQIKIQIGYATPDGASLRFKSGFESGVTITHSADGQRSYLHGADVFGYDWNDLNHEFNYVEDGSYPTRVNTKLDDSFTAPYAPLSVFNGSRSIRLSVKEHYRQVRNALEIYCHDGQSDNPKTISNLQEVYYSKWAFIPANFDLRYNGGWMATGSVREYGTYNGEDFTVHALIYENDGELYWHADARAYTSPHKYFWSESNHEVEVPLGRWFRWEIYVYRHRTDGVFRLWIDGVNVFNMTGVTTKWSTSDHSYRIKLMNVYTKIQSDSGADPEDYPFYMWFDDVEIWDGMPSRAGVELEGWEDGFESGDFSAWDGTQASDGTASVTSGYSYLGMYSANFTTDGSESSSARTMHMIQPVREVYQRSYVRFQGLPDTDNTRIMFLRMAKSDGTFISNAGVYKNSTGYYWIIRIDDVSNGVLVDYALDTTISPDKWYAIEFQTKTTVNGNVRLWVDGIKECELTGDFSSLGTINIVYPYIYVADGSQLSAKTVYHDNYRVDDVRVGSETPVAFQTSAYFLTAVEDEPAAFSPLEGVKINGTRLTDTSGYYEWANLVYNTIYTFVIEKPVGYYPAWVLNVEGSYSWNGTHYILSHNVRETQTGPIEIYFSSTEEVYMKSATHKLTSVSYNSSSQNPHTSMRFNITADIGVTSQMEIYTADEGHPRPYKIEGATDWSYDSLSKILTIWILRTSEEEAEIEWRGAAMGQ